MNGAQLHVVMWFLDYSPRRPPIPLSALALGFWNGETFRFKFMLFYLHLGWLWASGFLSLSLRFFILLNGDNNTPFIMRLGS